MITMDISAKYRKVQMWLENIFAGKPVPSFEKNEQTIDLLHQLMQKNVCRDQDTQLIVQDIRQKTTEYTAEGKRIARILGKLNLGPSTLSHSGIMSLRTLASLAWLLEIRDATDTSYLLGLKALQDEEDRVHEELLSEDRLLAQITNKTKEAVLKHSIILKACKELEVQSSQQESEVEKQLKDITFLRSKIQNYGDLVAKLESKLKKTGVNFSLFHENLVKKAQDLQNLEEELVLLRKKLQDFHDLPPDISQAKLKVAELQKQVSVLEKKLSQKIDVMKL